MWVPISLFAFAFAFANANCRLNPINVEFKCLRWFGSIASVASQGAAFIRPDSCWVLLRVLSTPTRTSSTRTSTRSPTHTTHTTLSMPKRGAHCGKQGIFSVAWIVFSFLFFFCCLWTVQIECVQFSFTQKQFDFAFGMRMIRLQFRLQFQAASEYTS